MRTSKPFSSISYNTWEFITKKLSLLAQQRKIAFAACIRHQPEDDETRYHIHVLVVPNCRQDTDELRDMFLEVSDSDTPPLAWMPCRSSSFQDWYLYSMHHSGYLALKHQARKYHYQRSDFFCTDETFFKDCIDRIDWSKINLMGQIIEAAKSGINFANFLESFNIPLNSFSSAQKLWQAVCSDETFRNERVSHDAAFFDLVGNSGDTYDAISGEIVSQVVCGDFEAPTA